MRLTVYAQNWSLNTTINSRELPHFFAQTLIHEKLQANSTTVSKQKSSKWCKHLLRKSPHNKCKINNKNFINHHHESQNLLGQKQAAANPIQKTRNQNQTVITLSRFRPIIIKPEQPFPDKKPTKSGKHFAKRLTSSNEISTKMKY